MLAEEQGHTLPEGRPGLQIGKRIQTPESGGIYCF